MSAPFVDNDEIVNAGSLQLGAGTTAVVWAPGRPVKIRKAILVVTTAQATSAATVTVAVRNVDDTSSTTKGTFATPATMALNAVYKVDLAKADPTAKTDEGGGISQPSTVTMGRVLGRQVSTPGEISVQAGQEIVFTSDGGGDTGVAQLYLEYRDLGLAAQSTAPTDISFTLS